MKTKTTILNRASQAISKANSLFYGEGFQMEIYSLCKRIHFISKFLTSSQSNSDSLYKRQFELLLRYIIRKINSMTALLSQYQRGRTSNVNFDILQRQKVIYTITKKTNVLYNTLRTVQPIYIMQSMSEEVLKRKESITFDSKTSFISSLFHFNSLDEDTKTKSTSRASSIDL